MKAKKVDISVKTIKVVNYSVEYQCPKCRCVFIDYGFDYKKITRFKCSCGQEIIANYIAQQ